METGFSKARAARRSVQNALAAVPVTNATNTMNTVFLRTFVADAVLCHPNEDLLLLHKQQDELRLKVWKRL